MGRRDTALDKVVAQVANLPCRGLPARRREVKERCRSCLDAQSVRARTPIGNRRYSRLGNLRYVLTNRLAAQ